VFDEIYDDPSAVQRHLAAPLLDERLRYLRHCADQGYKRKVLRIAARQLLWIEDLLSLSKSTAQIDLATIQTAAERWRCRQPPPINRKNGFPSRDRLAARAVKWLRFLDRLQSCADPSPAYAPLIQEFADHMREKCLSVRTIEKQSRYLQDFLSCCSRPLCEITMADVDEAIARKGRDDGYARVTVQSYASGLRTFLRYAGGRGYCSPGFADGVICPHVYREENLPVGPAWDDVQRLLATTEGDRPKDIRDRAIILLFAVYGLRSGEVRGLKLEDLDWERKLLFVSRPKVRNRAIYPLSQTVGESILHYLREARPRSSYREVFLTMRAPIQPLTRGSGFWQVVAHRLRALEIRSRRQGPHALRHACATHLLSEGLSLKEIGDHLGHRDPETTAIYAKVNLSGLREVARLPLGGLL
jgi:integrase/recombinase XerD